MATGYSRPPGPRLFVRTDLEARPDWLTRGACRTGDDPDLHFPTKDTTEARREYEIRVAQAKAVCRTCPVIAECFEYAMAAKEELGIWAATTNADRIRIRAEARRAALAAETDALAVAS